MIRVLALAAALLAAAPALSQTVQPSTRDLLKQAGNFYENCDARAGPDGARPEPNFVCLAFLAGLIEGYNTAAVANGNRVPYCLVRPTSLAELTDMIVAAVERGAPRTVPTAAVFHFIMTETFPCPDAGPQDGTGAGAASPADPQAPEPPEAPAGPSDPAAPGD